MKTLFITICCILLLNSLTGCIDLLEEDSKNSDSQAFKARLTSHSWQRSKANIPEDSLEIRWIWSFFESGEFTQKHYFTDHSGSNITEISNTGTYSILEQTSMNSGHLGFKLNLYYTDQHTPDLEPTPDPLTLLILETAYIQDDTLFLGKLRKIDDCDNESSSISEPIYKQYDAISSATATLSVLNCYGRPIEIDFDNPYYELIPTTTLQ